MIHSVRLTGDQAVVCCLLNSVLSPGVEANHTTQAGADALLAVLQHGTPVGGGTNNTVGAGALRAHEATQPALGNTGLEFDILSRHE